MEFIIWFAQAKGAKPSMLVQFLPFIIIFGLFWLLIIRPQRKREKEHQDMLNILKKGDKIVTSSGIFGEVISVAAQTAVVEIAPKVKVTLQRSAIAGKVTPEQFSGIQQSTENDEKASSSQKKKKK